MEKIHKGTIALCYNQQAIIGSAGTSAFKHKCFIMSALKKQWQS